MTETDREIIRIALNELSSMITVIEARVLMPYDRSKLEAARAILDADRPEDALREDLRDARQDAAGYKARAERADEDCRMMQDRLQRLIDAKPTVPMDMLIEIMSNDEVATNTDAALVASKYGYEVTE